MYDKWVPVPYVQRALQCTILDRVKSLAACGGCHHVKYPDFHVADGSFFPSNSSQGWGKRNDLLKR